jgi:hypothetical protein
MKKEYVKPLMEVMKIQQQNHLLAGSIAASNVANTDGFSLDTDGFEDSEGDY